MSRAPCNPACGIVVLGILSILPAPARADGAPAWKCVLNFSRVGDFEPSPVIELTAGKFPAFGETASVDKVLSQRRRANPDNDAAWAGDPSPQEEAAYWASRGVRLPEDRVSCSLSYGDDGELRFEPKLVFRRVDPRTQQLRDFSSQPSAPTSAEIRKYTHGNPARAAELRLKEQVNDGMGSSQILVSKIFRLVCWAENAPRIKETSATHILQSSLEKFRQPANSDAAVSDRASKGPQAIPGGPASGSGQGGSGRQRSGDLN